MDARLRQTLTGAFLATGCLFSASSHAYNAADDAEAQDREVKAAYDRGYKAAKEELAREATAKGTAATTPPANEARAQKSTVEAARKPILDIKHVYSETSDIETVQEVPVTSKPLGEQPGTQAPASSSTRLAPPKPVARRSPVATTDAWTDTDSLQNPQPVQRSSAPPRNAVIVRSTGRAQQQNAMPPEEFADDDGDDAVMPRTAQVYTTEPQYARPRTQYAPPPVAMRPPPQAYGYVQRPTSVAARPYAYYAPSAAWGGEYQPTPYAGRWYWSPEYGRWLYY
ncbi:hypothetical protein PTKU46_46010 [Paraburkholderia terrae]|uniref:hypothetical protein n=1 Tax=Paraburkholderia terrae TaxID=311230 RepID=UPI0030E2A26A